MFPLPLGTMMFSFVANCIVLNQLLQSWGFAVDPGWVRSPHWGRRGRGKQVPRLVFQPSLWKGWKGDMFVWRKKGSNLIFFLNKLRDMEDEWWSIGEFLVDQSWWTMNEHETVLEGLFDRRNNLQQIQDIIYTCLIKYFIVFVLVVSIILYSYTWTK